MKSFTAGSDASAPPPPAAAKGSKTADLKVRVLSALVMGPLVLLAVWAGGAVFQALLAVSALVALGEWVLMVASDRMPEAFWHSLLAMAVVMLSYLLGGPAAALALALALGFIVQASAGGGKGSWLLGLGIPYVTVGLVGLAWLREHPGLPLVLFCLFAVWATDIGAYAAGRAIGGPKLAPRISPKKTWAGLIGGMIAAAVFGVAVAFAVGARKPWLALLVGPLLAVVGQAGDLFESWVKRRFNVKDSSHLIPGHGGLLDRIDGLLVAAPVLAVFHATLGKTWQWW